MMTPDWDKDVETQRWREIAAGEKDRRQLAEAEIERLRADHDNKVAAIMGLGHEIERLRTELAKHRRAIAKMTPAIAPAYIPLWVKEDDELYPDDGETP